MSNNENQSRSRTKRRLLELLKATVGGLVVAAATLNAPAARATTVSAQPSLAERVNELRKQLAEPKSQGDQAESFVGFCNWGNHWDKWNNHWGNWHNWHNH